MPDVKKWRVLTMANIKKMSNSSYKITVSCGYDVNGKKIRQYKTWKPENGMTQKQAEREVNKIAVLFEQDCLKGSLSTAVKLEDFTEQWFNDYAKLKLKSRTIANYEWLKRRVYRDLGHFRLDKITPRHVQKFINDLVDGKREDGRSGKLAPKTIKNHVSFLSSVFDYAVKMQIVMSNPCRIATLPKPESKKKAIYTLEEAQQLLELLLQEDEKNKDCVLFIIMAIYTGFRRGELLGLEWSDFDFKHNMVTINRTSNYTVARGIFTDTPKTDSSYRSLKLPNEVVALLHNYREHQQKYIESLGDKWVGTDRLFTKWDGTPMFPNTPSLYFGRFCKRTGMRYVNVHQWRI